MAKYILTTTHEKRLQKVRDDLQANADSLRWKLRDAEVKIKSLTSQLEQSDKDANARHVEFEIMNRNLVSIIRELRTFDVSKASITELSERLGIVYGLSLVSNGYYEETKTAAIQKAREKTIAAQMNGCATEKWA